MANKMIQYKDKYLAAEAANTLLHLKKHPFHDLTRPSTTGFCKKKVLSARQSSQAFVDQKHNTLMKGQKICHLTLPPKKRSIPTFQQNDSTLIKITPLNSIVETLYKCQEQIKPVLKLPLKKRSFKTFEEAESTRDPIQIILRHKAANRADDGNLPSKSMSSTQGLVAVSNNKFHYLWYTKDWKGKHRKRTTHKKGNKGKRKTRNKQLY